MQIATMMVWRTDALPTPTMFTSVSTDRAAMEFGLIRLAAPGPPRMPQPDQGERRLRGQRDPCSDACDCAHPRAHRTVDVDIGATGIAVASSALLATAGSTITPASRMDTATQGPEVAAARPGSTKIPDPSIAPTEMLTTDQKPSFRSSCFATSPSNVNGECRLSACQFGDCFAQPRLSKSISWNPRTRRVPRTRAREEPVTTIRALQESSRSP